MPMIILKWKNRVEKVRRICKLRAQCSLVPCGNLLLQVLSAPLHVSLSAILKDSVYSAVCVFLY